MDVDICIEPFFFLKNFGAGSPCASNKRRNGARREMIRDLREVSV